MWHAAATRTPGCIRGPRRRRREALGVHSATREAASRNSTTFLTAVWPIYSSTGTRKPPLTMEHVAALRSAEANEFAAKQVPDLRTRLERQQAATLRAKEALAATAGAKLPDGSLWREPPRCWVCR